MSGFKGTPGPWRFERVWLRSPGSPTFIHVAADDGPVVPWSGFDRSGRGKRENSANARLIAAAPELLEACRRFVEEYGLRCGPEDELAPARRQDPIVAAAMRAIAKATGGKP